MAAAGPDYSGWQGNGFDLARLGAMSDFDAPSLQPAFHRRDLLARVRELPVRIERLLVA